jgi:hypothetical protein
LKSLSLTTDIVTYWKERNTKYYYEPEEESEEGQEEKKLGSEAAKERKGAGRNEEAK